MLQGCRHHLASKLPVPACKNVSRQHYMTYRLSSWLAQLRVVSLYADAVLRGGKRGPLALRLCAFDASSRYIADEGPYRVLPVHLARRAI